MKPIFSDRTDAGRRLAERLLKYKPEHPLVLAIPRGGVPVGYEVAKALGAVVDTIVARKIGATHNPEFGIGAIAPGGVLIIDGASLAALELEKGALAPVIERERREMERRIARYKSGQYSAGAQETDTVIIVDDGLATGVTARAATESVSRQRKWRNIVFAAPICAKDTADSLKRFADVVCVHATPNLVAIGAWYEHFPQTTDEEVTLLLAASCKILPHPEFLSS